MPLESSHFWIIDGLDECSDPSGLFKFLLGLPSGLRVLVSSRSTPEIDRGISSTQPLVDIHYLSNAEIVSDMRAVIESRLHRLSCAHAAELASRVLRNSSGSFLWVRLVPRELDTAFTDCDIEAIFEQVPGDLSEMYHRILKTIAADERRAKLAKAILRWVSLAVRPLLVDELCHGVQQDLNEKVHNIEHAITATCGQLVIVDQSHRVQLVHETSLHYSGDTKGTTLLEYAADAFSYHLCRSSARNDTTLVGLAAFLENDILRWVEYVAASGNLNPLARAAADIGNYLSKRALNTSSDISLQRLQTLQEDMRRLVTKFPRPLLECPSAIHNIIPSFCPMDSEIFKTFGTQEDKLSVMGWREKTWNDYAVCVNHNSEKDSRLASNDEYFVLGSKTGHMFVYDAVSLLIVHELQHPGPISLLKFVTSDRRLVSAGNTDIIVWHVATARILHRSEIPQSPPQDVLLHKSLLTICLSNGELIFRDLGMDHQETIDLFYLGTGLEALDSGWQFVLSTQEICLLAFTLGRGNLHVVDFGSMKVLATRSADDNAVSAMAFHPDPKPRILIAAHDSGLLVMYDAETLCPLTIRRLSRTTCLSWSSDGQQLVTGNGYGYVHVFDFSSRYTPTVTHVYSLNAYHEKIVAVFSSHGGQRLLSLDEASCKIWNPSALRRRPKTEDTRITCMAVLEHQRAVIYRDNRGQVIAYSMVDGSRLVTLYHHTPVAQIFATLAGDRTLVCIVDDHGQPLVAETKHGVERWAESTVIFDQSIGTTIRKVIFGSLGKSLLVQSFDFFQVWDLESLKIIKGETLKMSQDGVALVDLLNEDAFPVLGGSTIRRFCWRSFQEISSLGFEKPGGQLALSNSVCQNKEWVVHLYRDCCNPTILTVVCTDVSQTRPCADDSDTGSIELPICYLPTAAATGNCRL
ncbi:hypothetical protein FDECE_11880 [Fusarium decemcellulare]|nr:hypothetical protein FDECE_11880 [Fusarium decemcellulare]